MEQERNTLRCVHESVSRKYFDLSKHLNFLSLMLRLFVSYEYLRYVVEKSAAESRVKELEELLASRDGEVTEAAESAASREEQLVDHVVFLARNVRGKY